MARARGKSVTRTITTTIEKVISDYPLLVLHSAFILGVMLGQAAKSRFSVMDWARNALPDTPRALAAALPSYTRRSSSARRNPGRPKNTGRRASVLATRSRRRTKPKAAAAAAE